MAAPKDDSVRSVIRSILVSNAFEMTAATLDRDFKDMEGYCIPYSKFGYRSLVDYLRSIPDAVTIKGGNPSNPVLVPVTKEEAAHIDKMVRKQKVASHRPRRMPARRSLNNNVSVTKHACTFGKGPVSQVPRNIHNKPETQQNASDTNRPRINVEFLKRRMASIIQGNMRKVKTSYNPFKNKCAVDSTFLQNQIKNFKIKTDYSTYEVGPKTNEPNGSRGATKQADTMQMSLGSSQLPHGGGLLFNSNGKFNLPNLSHSNPLAGQPIFNTSPNVSFLSSSRTTEPRWNYAKENTSKPPPRSAPPPMQQNQPSQQLKVVSGERRRNLCAAGAEGSRQEAEWWTTESPAAVLSGERRRNLCAAGAEGSRQEAEWWTTESPAAETNSEPSWRTESSASRVAAGADNSPERRNSSSSDFSEDDYEYDTRISHKMQKNFKILLERRPDGFLCSELPALYESEFQASFCCQDYGYNSVIQMAAEHPNIFNFSRIDRTSDWLLKRPEQKDCPQKKQDTLKPFLPKRIIENVLELLKLYPDGLPMNFLLERYQNYFNEPFDYEKYGESLEAVINDLEKFVHKRRAGKVILLYPVSKMKETVLDDKSLAFSAALPNIQANILHKDLYPDECCNYDDNIPIQKLPEFNESSYVEVRVSDLASPHEMWFHVAKCYSSLMIMMDDLHKFYSAYESEYVMPEVTIKPRQLCACVFGEMKKWHRAIISSCIKEKRCVVVEYIDYGTKMSVDQSILRFLHKDFAVMARQAIKGRLLEVQPPAGCEKWPVTSNEYLIDLTVDRRLLLEVINIRHLSPQDFMVEGFLYDTNGEDDIIINDEMVKSGHAMLKENATDVENCPSPTVKPSISQLNSPNSSDIPVVWRGKTATSQPSQYPDTHTSSHMVPSASSLPYNYRSSYNGSGSLSSHSMSSNSRHSCSPGIIYYNLPSLDMPPPLATPPLATPPLATPPLATPQLATSPLATTPLSTPPLSVSSGKYSSPSSCALSSPLSSSPKSEPIGESLNSHSLPPPSTVTPPTCAPTAAAPEPLPRRPPPGFDSSATNQPQPPVSQPSFYLYPTPEESLQVQLAQLRSLSEKNQAVNSMMMQQLLNPPMPMSYNIMWPPNYYGMPLHPILGNPLVNSLASQYNQPNYFPNSAANTFVTNSLYQQNPLLNVGLPTTPANVPMNAGPVPPPPPAPSPPATVTAGSCHADSSSGETVLAPPSPSPTEQESVAVKSPVNQLSDALQDSDANTETTAEVEILEETRSVSKDPGNDWETYDSANEANRESADSDVDTDAGGQAARRPTFNPLTQRTSKPMSRSARKRLRKSMLKNKGKGSAAATLPVIADNSESNLTTTDFISSSASTTTKDSSNEAEDSVSTSDSRANNETKDKSKSNKTNKKGLKKNEESKSEVVANNQTSAKKRAERPRTELRRPNCTIVELEQNTNVALTGIKITTDEIKNEQSTAVETKDTKSSVVEVENEKSSVDKEDFGKSSVCKDRNDKLKGNDTSNKKSSDNKVKEMKESSAVSITDDKKSEDRANDKKIPCDDDETKSKSIAITSDNISNKTIVSDQSLSKSDCAPQEENSKRELVKDRKSWKAMKSKNEKPESTKTTGIKLELVKDWKLLDSITKDSIYVPKPAKEQSATATNDNVTPENHRDIIDRIISSVGAHVFNKTEAEIIQSTPKEPIQQKAIESKIIHIFEYNKQPTVCTDEIISLFTNFTKRLAVNKALDFKQAVKPYFDITRKANAELFKLLDSCKICGITKGETQIPDKLSVLPLQNVSNLLKNLGAAPSVVGCFSDLFEELNATM